jgi:predicted DNA-binding transcriptional regulator YafY
MRPADRLFRLVQLIRGRRLSTAAFLAERLEVSLRTVYRDVAQLQHQGVPIEGEAGVGYRLGSGFELPPLMFTQDEASALVAAVRMAQVWLDPKLALSAEASLSKILSILPTAARAAAESSPLYVPTFKLDKVTQQNLQTLREAAQKRQKVELLYLDLSDKTSQRVVRPLGCFFWGKVWTLGAWCETRQDFRSFRLDRMQKITVSDTTYALEADKGLADYLGRVGAKELL